MVRISKKQETWIFRITYCWRSIIQPWTYLIYFDWWWYRFIGSQPKEQHEPDFNIKSFSRCFSPKWREKHPSSVNGNLHNRSGSNKRCSIFYRLHGMNCKWKCSSERKVRTGKKGSLGRWKIGEEMLSKEKDPQQLLANAQIWLPLQLIPRLEN